jgi:hypothetical protein
MPPHHTQQITQNLADMLWGVSPEREMVRVPTSGQEFPTSVPRRVRPANKGWTKGSADGVGVMSLALPPAGRLG